LYWPIFGYLSVIFSREDFRANQILLLGVLFLIAAQARKGNFKLRLDAPPRLARWPLTLALGGSVLYLLAERFLDVNTIAASLFGLASYGLLGLWLEPRRWRQGVPAILLLIGVLPFGDHMQTFIGYPMRILTAVLVRDGLTAAGVASLGVDTILVFENGVSQIDIPCSGVKSLWTGMLFLIAATWVEKRPLSLRWLGTAVIFSLLLFIVNLARVAILVIVGEVAGWRLMAEMLHVPLGVLGFVAACVTAVYLLRRLALRIRSQIKFDKETHPQRLDRYPKSKVKNDQALNDLRLTINDWEPAANRQFTIILMAAIALMALLYAPRPQTGLAKQPPALAFPTELSIEPLPLKPDEIEWLTRDGAASANRMRFEWRGISGSMILITSRTWRAHHRPERCFEVYGLTLDDSRAHLVAPDFPLRLVSLGGRQTASLSASYWFQSVSQTTDDYGTRIWADLAPQRDKWILVSILFDGEVDPHDEDISTFYQTLHQAVNGVLE
ncbi:MAG: exosortase O, partial [Chloroflexi bacterium]|nr:exosortase O [Chloroflexota bacterium]